MTNSSTLIELGAYTIGLSTMDRLVTVGTFETVVKAHIAKHCLDDAGIWNVLTDENIVDMYWLVSNAVQGVKLKVRESDVEIATQILNESESQNQSQEEAITEEELTSQALAATPEVDYSDTSIYPKPAAVGDGTDILNGEKQEIVDRDALAWRAFVMIYLGLLCCPVSIYGLYLFLMAVFSEGKLTWVGRVSLFLCIPYLLVLLGVLIRYSSR